jgi:hypothetical protein
MLACVYAVKCLFVCAFFFVILLHLCGCVCVGMSVCMYVCVYVCRFVYVAVCVPSPPYQTARRLLSSPKMRRGGVKKGVEQQLEGKALETLPALEGLLTKLEGSRAKSAELYTLLECKLTARTELYQLREQLVLARQHVVALRDERQEVSQVRASTPNTSVNPSPSKPCPLVHE